jgi:RNA polymerase-binding transcription factor DksA
LGNPAIAEKWSDTMDPNNTAADVARARLNDEKQRLEELLSTLRSEHIQDGAIHQLGGDAAADTTSEATYLGVRQDLQKQVKDVDAALKRVDEGTYGIDELTGEPIDPARLEAEPTARTNVPR